MYYIQKLLVNKLDEYKEKENNHAEEHIKKIQDVYKQEDIIMKEQVLETDQPLNQLC